MSERDAKQVMEDMRDQLEADRADGKLAGLTIELLENAMAHPKASEVVQELMEIEPHTVQVGDPAPDFTLPWLPGSQQGDEPTLTLSDHIGDRPVALVFGSYT